MFLSNESGRMLEEAMKVRCQTLCQTVRGPTEKNQELRLSS